MSSKNIHALEIEESLRALQTQKDGLSRAEAAKRLAEYGANEIISQGGRTLWQMILEQFSDVLILLLLGATVISALLGEYLDAGAMLSIVLLSAVLGIVQEFRAEKAVEALQRFAALRARVWREGHAWDIEASELVPGDIILLEAGDMIPADGRLIEAEQLRVEEASLTGESVPVEKLLAALAPEVLLNEQQNMVFRGTPIVHGTGRAVVAVTGMQTQVGKIAQDIQQTETQQTPLQIKFARIARRIGWIVVVAIVVVFVATLLRKPPGEPLQAYLIKMLLFSLSLAVAAVPSSLPAIVTIGLAMGARRLAESQMIVKRLPAAESLGSVTVICSDKTGTLTKNAMTVTHLWTGECEYSVTGVGYQPVGEIQEGGKPCAPAEVTLPLRIGALCNHAQLEQEDGVWKVVGDPTEGALLVLARKSSDDTDFAAIQKVQEFPFDSERKMMSTIVRNAKGEVEALCKGAPDVLLARCDRYFDGKAIVAMDAEKRAELQGHNEALANRALRVLGLAYKPLEDHSHADSSASTQDDATQTADGPVWTQADAEEGLVFAGLVGMLDPPREEVQEAIARTAQAGIQVIVITGDHAATARAIAQQIGLIGPSENAEEAVLTGVALESMDDEALLVRLRSIRIIARALPEHKLRIVRLLQQQGHVVAMTGDGVNDAPALKKADIGIAMGMTGTDVAKEVSETIVVDDNFASIVRAIEEGRNIYDKMLKSTRYLLSCNAGEVFLVFFAVMAGFPLPLLPLQILLMNLVTDGLPALALGTEPADRDVMSRPPRRPDENPLDRVALLQIGLFGLVMGIGTLGLFAAYHGQSLDKARTVAFTALVMFEMFAVFGARSLRPFRQINPFSNRWLIPAVLSSVLLQVVVVYWSPLQKVFKTVPLSPLDWLWILLVSSLGFLLMELGKYLSRK